MINRAYIHITGQPGNREMFDKLLGWRYNRKPVTTVVANLLDPGDAGRKKAMTRIKRAIAKGKQG